VVYASGIQRDRDDGLVRVAAEPAVQYQLAFTRGVSLLQGRKVEKTQVDRLF
jgi:hypothetical protein